MPESKNSDNTLVQASIIPIDIIFSSAASISPAAVSSSTSYSSRIEPRSCCRDVSLCSLFQIKADNSFIRITSRNSLILSPLGVSTYSPAMFLNIKPLLTFIIRSDNLMTHALLNLCNVINYNKAFKQFLCKN